VSNQLNICIVHPNPGPQCETFIQVHTQRLPGVKLVLYGGHMPLFDKQGRKLHADLPEDATLLFAPDGELHNEHHKTATANITAHLQKNNIDVVLAEYGPTGVALMEACHRASVPLVTHFHGFDASMKTVLKKYAQGYDALFKRVAAVVGVSMEMKKDLLALGAQAKKLTINPYGVDATFFAESNPETAPPHFISVGRFVDKKSPETVIRAFNEVIRSFPAARLTMIGDGVLKKTTQQLAHDMGLEEWISFPGQLPHDQVAQAMRQARCFVQHSVTPASGDKEGTPNSVLEASASGLPVVATRHAGIADAVINETTGLLCEENDMNAMAEHMIRMAENPQEAKLFGKAGRKHMERNYNMTKRLNILANILKNAYRDSK
jgi:glycosyltransferase involved in cell wall biosynthesis